MRQADAPPGASGNDRHAPVQKPVEAANVVSNPTFSTESAISRPPPNMSDSRFFAESHFPVADQEARLGFSFGEWPTPTRAPWKIGDVKSPTLAPPASRRKNKIAGQPLCTQHQEP